MNKPKSIITIGNFDGVHLGHRHIINAMHNFATSEKWREQFFSDKETLRTSYLPSLSENLNSVIITFTPHPASVLGNKFFVPLTTYEKRLKLLHEISNAKVCEIPFTKEFSTKTSLEFCEYLVKEYDMAMLFVGYDLKIGSDRADFAKLQELGKKLGFSVYAHSAIKNNETIISSTKIREHLLAGRIQEANAMLGYAYSLSGIVEHGFNRGGKLLGFPTANLSEDTLVVPQNGVYATKVKIFDTRFTQEYLAVTNIGYNPTFEGNARTIETFILDFDADIYDCQIEVSFHSFMRTETKFSSLDELIAQLNQDVAKAKDFFGVNHE